MSQNVKVNIGSDLRDRLNRMKPDLGFHNITSLIGFIIDIYEIVLPVIQDDSLSEEKKAQVITQLHEKRGHLKIREKINNTIKENDRRV